MQCLEGVSGTDLCVCVPQLFLLSLFSPLRVLDGAGPVSRPSPCHLGVHGEILRKQMGTPGFFFFPLSTCSLFIY